MSEPHLPTVLEPQPVSVRWTVLPSAMPVPGLGVLPVNAFLYRGAEPGLVDTGLADLEDDFLAVLTREIALDDLRWIWVSHADADHVGNLARLLDLAPHARVVTNFLGMGKLAMQGFDMGRAELLAPGVPFRAGDRDLQPLRPPYYDAPETMGFYDPADRLLFAADSFGAVLPAPAGFVEMVADDALRAGLLSWARIDAPWLEAVDRQVLGRTLRALDQLDPQIVLSSHLPPTLHGIRTLTRTVWDAYCGTRPPANDMCCKDRQFTALAGAA